MRESFKVFMEDWGLYILGLALGSLWYYKILSGIPAYLALLSATVLILYSFYLDYETMNLLKKENY